MDVKVSKAGRLVTMVLASAGVFMLMLDLTVVNVALPQIRIALHANFSDLQWVIDSYAVSLASFLLFWGSLADIKGRKRVFLGALFFFAISSLVCALSSTPVELIAGRGVQGIAAAALFAVGPALLGHEFRGKERAMAFSIFGGMAGLAIALGPLIGGFLTNFFSWRWIFFINLPIGIISLTLGFRFLPESKREISPKRVSSVASGGNDVFRQNEVPKVDLGGVFFFALASALLVVGLVEGSADGWVNSGVIAELSSSFVSLIIFLFVELRKGQSAAFPLRLFRNMAFNGISIVAFIANAVIIPTILLEALYLEGDLHLNAYQAGIRFLPLTLSLFISAALAGGLLGRVSVRILAATSMVLTGVGLYLVTLFGVDSGWTALVPSMVITGIGIGMVNPVRAATAIAIMEPGLAGTASAINETFQQLGPAVGVAGVGAIFVARVSASFSSLVAVRYLPAQALKTFTHNLTSGVFRTKGTGSGSSTELKTVATEALTKASHLAYLNGMHFVMLVCAGLSFLAAAVALLIREKDMYSEVSLIPPDFEEENTFS